MTTVIIGYGFIGTHLYKELEFIKPDIYDKYNGVDTRKFEHYDIAWVCVPTPYDTCEIDEVLNAIKENDADIFVIKSTVLPSKIEKIKQSTKSKVIFCPEFYGRSKDSTTFNHETILGGDREVCDKVITSIQPCFNGNHKYLVTTDKTAMLLKYMSNAFMLTKQTFCNQFYLIAESMGVSYNELRDLLILDPRITGVRTTVNPDELRLKHHCHSKDIPAIANDTNNEFLKFIASYHEVITK
ncbi:MAG: hypothetical protein WCQ65_09880 [Fermentimonas sp.]